MNAEQVKIGCFQILVLHLLSINYVIVSMSHVLPYFHNYTPQFYCEVPETKNRTYGCTVPILPQVADNLTSDFSPSKSQVCVGEYIFEQKNDERSVVTEWGLICEKEYLKNLGFAVYLVGALMGAWIAGFLADRIGRLPVLAICLYTQGTMAVALYAVQDYPVFLVLRGLQGVFVQGLQNCTYVLTLELFPAKARAIVALIMQVAWACGIGLLAGLSYVISDWRILQLAISVPTAITVLYIWIIPESPRWLIAKGKLTEADLALEKISKYNGLCRSRTIKKSQDNIEEETSKADRKSRISNTDIRLSKTEQDLEESKVLLPISEPNTPQSHATNREVEDQDKKPVEHKETNLDEDISLSINIAPASSSTIDIDTIDTNNQSEEKAENECQLKTKDESSENSKNAEESIASSESKKTKKKCEVKLPKQQEKSIEDGKETITSQGTKRYNIIRKYGFIMMHLWFSSSMAFHMTTSLLPKMSNDIHISFGIGAAMEMFAFVVTYFFLSKYGRRVPLCSFQLLSGAICITIAVFALYPQLPAVWIVPTKTSLLLVGKVLNVGSFFALNLFTIEIFPTIHRGTVLGICVVAEMIGGLASYTLILGKYTSNAIPISTIGFLSISAGLLVLLLPETLHEILPDAIEDSQYLGQKDPRNQSNDGIVKKINPLQIPTKKNQEKLREKLFSEDWVDAGNGIIVNFTEGKSTE